MTEGTSKTIRYLRPHLQRRRWPTKVSEAINVSHPLVTVEAVSRARNLAASQPWSAALNLVEQSDRPVTAQNLQNAIGQAIALSGMWPAIATIATPDSALPIKLGNNDGDFSFVGSLKLQSAALSFLKSEPPAFKTAEHTRFAKHFLTAEDVLDRDENISRSTNWFIKNMVSRLSEHARQVRMSEKLGFVTDEGVRAINDNAAARSAVFGPLTDIQKTDGNVIVIKSKVMNDIDTIARTADIDLDLVALETALREFGRALVRLDDKQALQKYPTLPGFALSDLQRERLQSYDAQVQVAASAPAFGLLDRAVEVHLSEARFGLV